jgi:hypothetical protein
MTVTRREVMDGCVYRMVGVWPGLRKRVDLQREIGAAIMRHAPRLTVEDIAQGMDDLVGRARTQQDDGGPAAPPGPHEVVGCILTAARARTLSDTTAPAPGVPREVVAADDRLRADIERGQRVSRDDVATSNTARRYVPGLSFSDWWATVPEAERPRHAALYAMMGGGDA